MKKHSIILLIAAAFCLILFLAFTGCTKSVKLFTFDFITKEGTVFATSTVSISFEVSDEGVHIFKYVLDGNDPATTVLNAITFEGLSAGEHMLNLSAIEIPEASKTILFTVNLNGPTVEVRTADREYDIEGSAAPMGRNALILWNYDTYDLMAQRLSILEYDEEWGDFLVPDGEGGFTRLSPYTDPTAQEQAWIDLSTHKRSFYASDRCVVINDVLYDLFEIGKSYNIFIQGQSNLGTWGNIGNIRFRLDERYASDQTPVIEFEVTELTLPTSEASGMMTVTFTGQNIKEYCAKPVHDYFQNDTTQNSELMYLQFGLDLLFDGASLTSIEFPHFSEGYDDYSFWQEYYWGYYFSRGFVENQSNTDAGTEVLASVNFALDSSVNDDGIYLVIPYSNMYIRDQSNRTIDGIQVDHTIFRLDLNEGE
jgi:hypothetical protein